LTCYYSRIPEEEDSRLCCQFYSSGGSTDLDVGLCSLSRSGSIVFFVLLLCVENDVILWFTGMLCGGELQASSKGIVQISGDGELICPTFSASGK